MIENIRCISVAAMYERVDAEPNSTELDLINGDCWTLVEVCALLSLTLVLCVCHYEPKSHKYIKSTVDTTKRLLLNVMKSQSTYLWKSSMQ